MEPLKISKVNTAAQLVLVVGVLGIEGYRFDVGEGVEILTYVVAITTTLSGAAYAYLWSKKAIDYEDEENKIG